MCMMPGAAPSAMHRWGMQHRCQLGVACFVGVQNNGNVKSKPKYLTCARISNTCFLLLNSFSFFCRSLGFSVGRLLCFFSSELPAVGCIQHLFMYWAPQNTCMYVTKGQLHCPPLLPSPRNVVPTSLCNVRI